MKPAHKLINSQVNKRDKCLGLTTASSEINQGIITYLSHTGLVLVLWALSYYIVIMCNTSLADMGEHWASKAALNLLLIFNYTDVPFHSLKTLTCILTFFPILPHTLHVDVLPIWSGHWIWRWFYDCYFPFSSSVAQAVGTPVVNTAYRARKAKSLTDQLLKIKYSWKQQQPNKQTNKQSHKQTKEMNE